MGNRDSLNLKYHPPTSSASFLRNTAHQIQHTLYKMDFIKQRSGVFLRVFWLHIPSGRKERMGPHSIDSHVTILPCCNGYQETPVNLFILFSLTYHIYFLFLSFPFLFFLFFPFLALIGAQWWGTAYSTLREHICPSFCGKRSTCIHWYCLTCFWWYFNQDAFPIPSSGGIPDSEV